MLKMRPKHFCYLILAGISAVFILVVIFFHNGILTNFITKKTLTITKYSTHERLIHSNITHRNNSRDGDDPVENLLKSGDKALEDLTKYIEAEKFPWTPPSNTKHYIEIYKDAKYMKTIEKLTASPVLLYKVHHTDVNRHMPVSSTFNVTANSPDACEKFVGVQKCSYWQDLGPSSIKSHSLDLFWFKHGNPSITSPFLPMGNYTKSGDVLLTYVHVVRSAVIDFSGVVFTRVSAIVPSRCRPSRLKHLPQRPARLPHYQKASRK